jgi:hypothetical protein
VLATAAGLCVVVLLLQRVAGAYKELSNITYKHMKYMPYNVHHHLREN